ncbi:uncharacterized protein A1O5_09905 [Cladophialophora psammophila CBS 110553]|uniref:Uncharacterized protein n=1 Tax=Cladophialophora psammophila CBS 110553 TaxID=1182543 RepID=W9WH56_9EURO|nr:uncharacterized protein A1O5_09905 [Cladophialophora psammophila CBS 110553]EXJ67258.1 hypothetical protein A1O5_09905 [Cladophialophora psammophila CBS 110553]
MQNFVFEMDPKDPKTLKRTVLRDMLDFRLPTSWVRLALSAEGEQETALQTSLCDANSPLNLDRSLPDRIKNLFMYKASTKAPTSESEDVKMLSTSETGVYAPLDPNDVIKVQQTQNNTTIEIE